ncbi:MAG TPA: phospholipase D-like domain-containing protein [Lacibacter sp.]|nr:phospholipase D-like domain-containing protein [Lacibacter sp.]HMO90049.1 phospholipase D-like domain-containing protein [Lacibacter sp.]
MSAVRPTLASVYTPRNQVQLVEGGRSYFDRLLELIGQAQHTLHFQTYIFDADETGLEVATALEAAASRGVAVFLLLDGYASQSLPVTFITKLKAVGIRHRWFEPLLRGKSYYFGRRLHHKVVVADARMALVGGINISNRYNDLPDAPAWLDWALDVRGEAALQLDHLCFKLWNKSSLRRSRPIAPVVQSQQVEDVPECLVRVRRNDWVNRRVDISRSYLEMLRRAEKEIIIMSSYFLPGRLFRTALQRTIRRGVDIKIIIAGTSDIKIAKAAERYWYPWLLKQGIRIYEYEPRVLHGKLSVYDEKWVTVGSYNINNISAYASIELNLDVLNNAFGSSTREKLIKIIRENCTEITPERFARRRNLFTQFIDWFSYEFYRAIVFLFTFYFRQRKKE